MTSENQPLQLDEEKKSQSFILANIKTIARTLGLITIAVLWVSTVLIIKDHNSSYVGYYLIRQGCCCRIWSGIMWVDNWKKFILYILLSVPLFLEDFRLVFGIVSGLLLMLLSTMYLIKTFRSHVAVTYEKTERRFVSTKTPVIRTVTHEMSTQTDSSQPYAYSTTEIPEDGGSR